MRGILKHQSSFAKTDTSGGADSHPHSFRRVNSNSVSGFGIGRPGSSASGRRHRLPQQSSSSGTDMAASLSIRDSNSSSVVHHQAAGVSFPLDQGPLPGLGNMEASQSYSTSPPSASGLDSLNLPERQSSPSPSNPFLPPRGARLAPIPHRSEDEGGD